MNLQKKLIGHWTMDNRDTSGVARDRSGYTREGSLGSGVTTGQSSPVGEGYNFNGSDSSAYVSGPSVTIPNKYTLACWIKGTLSNQNSSNNYNLGWDSHIGLAVADGSNNARGGILIRNSADSGYRNVWNGDNFLDGSWHHMAATVDRSTLEVIIYMDGSQIWSETIPDHYSGSHSLTAGTWSTGYGSLTGDMSDCRFYARVLSSNEISALATQRTPRHNKHPLSEGLKGHWTCDNRDTSGGVARDRSGHGNHGDLLGGMATGKSGVVNEAYSCTTSDDYVELSPELNLPSEWAYSVWVNAQNVANGNWNTFTRGNGGDHQVILDSSTGELGMYDNAGSTGFNGTGYDGTKLQNSWHHLAVNASGGVQDFYVNDSLVGSTSVQSTTDIRSIGNYFGGSQSWGLFDEFKVYHRTLSSDEISFLANQHSPNEVQL